MPELPEVEIIRQIIEPQIQGFVVEKVDVRRPEVVAYPTAEEFCHRITGQTFDGIERRGKFLAIRLENGDRITVHLRMTGCLLLTPKDYPEEKHTHIVFDLQNGKQLRFSDTRRFGRLWLFGKDEADNSGIEKLGVEPLEKTFTAEYLYALLRKRKKAVKECLLDQSIIAGIGNIYSDEILFTAGIHPARPANSLSMEECVKLSAAVTERISYFIEVSKITPEEYLKSKGQDYRNTPFLQVYGQEENPCPICKTILCRMIIGGRSSTFCPNCQKN